MAKKQKSAQVAADVIAPELSWQQTRFVEAYVLNGGNATRAAIEAQYGLVGAGVRGCELLKIRKIQEAVELKRQELQGDLQFDRKQALRILVARATASMDDFAQVLCDPEVRANYKHLGFKRFAIKHAKKSRKTGNEVTLYDGAAALESLWEKLGLGEGDSRGNWFDGLGDLAEAVRAIKGKKR